MKFKKGFTLVELVLIIVLLGILAATAIPRIINIARDARVNNLAYMASQLESVSRMVHLKCKLTPSCKNTTWGQVYNIDGKNVMMLYGWVDAGSYPGVGSTGIDVFLDVPPKFVAIVTPDHTETRWQLSSAPDQTTCYFFYRQQPGVRDPNIGPTVGTVTTGC